MATIPDWPEAVAQAKETLRIIDEDISLEAYSKAGEFFDSLVENISGVLSSIEQYQSITENQWRALNNWRAAVSKWT